MSAVREAIKAVLAGYEGHDATSRPDVQLLDALVKAVEAVPVQVTIRELDMADNENIVTVRSGSDLDYLLAHVTEAVIKGSLHLTVDGGYLKVKAGDYGTWCAPVPTEVYNP